MRILVKRQDRLPARRKQVRTMDIMGPDHLTMARGLRDGFHRKRRHRTRSLGHNRESERDHEVVLHASSSHDWLGRFAVHVYGTEEC